MIVIKFVPTIEKKQKKELNGIANFFFTDL